MDSQERNSSMSEFNHENRIIYINGTITEAKAEVIVSKLLHYECSDPTKDILMILDSYGGSADSFIAIHDTMKLLRCDVATICIGKAMSCAQMILMSGTKGKRFITPNSRVLVHSLRSQTLGKITDIEINFNELKRIQKEIIEKLILKYSNLTKTDLNNAMKQDNFFTANEAVKAGLVDYTINSLKDLYKKIDI